MSICIRCNGVGMVHCEECDGSGRFSEDFCTGCANTSMMECPQCEGTGREGRDEEQSVYETESIESQTNSLSLMLVAILSIFFAGTIALALFYQPLS